jgi:hypothetical protein
MASVMERRAMKRQLQLKVFSAVGCPLPKRQRGSEAERNSKKRLHDAKCSPVGCPLPKRQRDNEQQVIEEFVESDILILDIDEFTIRLFDEMLRI